MAMWVLLSSDVVGPGVMWSTYYRHVHPCSIKMRRAAIKAATEAETKKTLGDWLARAKVMHAMYCTSTVVCI